MFRNYITVAIRNIKHQKAYALINIFGLSMSIATSILILLFVLFEKSYDRYHKNADRIYRVYTEGRMADTEFRGAYTAVPSAPAFYSEIPDVISFTRIDRWENVQIRDGNQTYLEDNFCWVDSGFFNIFSFPLIYGNSSQVLTEPRSMVISQSAAERYYGNENPVGHTLKIASDSADYTITGVMQDIPLNSHFHCDFVVDFQTNHRAGDENWTSNNLYTYLLTGNGTRQPDLEAKIDVVTRKYVGAEIAQFIGQSLEEWESAGNYYHIRVQPLEDVHMSSDIPDSMEPPSDKKYIYIFTLVALFIICIACMNYINLATARSAGRAREVGIRKVAGSGRRMLVWQFLAESFVMVIIGMLIAVLAVELLLPVFNRITLLELSLDYFGKWYTLPLLILFAILVGLLAGSYPAFFLSSFKPVCVLGGKLAAGARSGILRSLLVILQFGISIFIILCTFVITRQLQYLLNKDLGFDSDQIVVLERFSEVGKDRVETFKQEIARIPGVLSSTSSTMVPGHITNYNGHGIEGRPVDQVFLLHVNYIDYDFPETYELEITSGRFLCNDFATDSSGIVINETAERNFNIQDPLTCSFIQPAPNPEDRVHLPVIGVMKDIHAEALQTEVKPYMMRARPANWSWIPYLSIRLEPGNYQSVLKHIENVWDEFTAGQPFQYFFLDDDFEQHYKQEKRTRVIFVIFAVFAILVACLGLLGLTSFSTEKRAREIGIRKAMGASSPLIVRLLAKEILLLVGIAALIAWPAAWYFSRNWLNDFAYRIDLTVVPFLVSTALAIFIALVATSFQSVRAALQNPADSLRNE